MLELFERLISAISSLALSIVEFWIGMIPAALELLNERLSGIEVAGIALPQLTLYSLGVIAIGVLAGSAFLSSTKRGRK